MLIHAMRYFPPAEEASIVNRGVVMATLLSILIFHERSFWKTRLACGLIIRIGLLVMALVKI